MEPAIAKEMIRGAPDTLHSEFHLEYSMLLNLLRWGHAAAIGLWPQRGHSTGASWAAAGRRAGRQAGD